MSYDSNIKKNIEKGKKGEYSNPKDKENLDYVIRKRLNYFNEALLKGEFFRARNLLSDIYWNIASTKEGIPSELADSYSQNEKEKLIGAINKRIERGKNYLEKHSKDKKFNENKEYMERILDISDDIEATLLPKKPSSRLEKSLRVLSIGLVLLGIFFLSPNLTGNAIGALTGNSANILGAISLALGVVGIVLLFKK